MRTHVDFDAPTIDTQGLRALLLVLQQTPYHFLTESGREHLALLQELEDGLPRGLEPRRILTQARLAVATELRDDPEAQGLDFRRKKQLVEDRNPDLRKVEISGFRTYYYVA